MGTLMDYAELAVQFGYITLFVVAFPLAPFLALANNYVEARSDAFKLLTQMQRPVPRGAEDIGSWQQVFTIITCVSVLTNSALVRTKSSSCSSQEEKINGRGRGTGGRSHAPPTWYSLYESGGYMYNWPVNGTTCNKVLLNLLY